MADRRAERREALRQRLLQGPESLLITHLPNIRYLTGFTGSSAMLLVTPDRVVLVSDPRYETQASDEVDTAATVVIESQDVWARLQRVLQESGVGRLGFESDRLTVRAAERLRSGFDGQLEPTEGLVDRLRVTKDDDEVEAIRRAAHLAHEAFEAVLPTIAAGDSERVIAGRLEAALRERGSEGHPFPTIVASGPRSALPHAGTGDRRLRSGDLLLLDFGAQSHGYCADLTRTVVVGPADGRQREVYTAVQESARAALAGLRPGMTGQAADALARESLGRQGLGEAFRHSLGHGLGLEVHEDPRLARTALEPLPVGAVVTVEPGAYFEGWGGVRLEDDILLAPEGPVHLSPPAPPLIELL